jgi:hypothetical protein
MMNAQVGNELMSVEERDLLLNRIYSVAA